MTFFRCFRPLLLTALLFALSPVSVQAEQKTLAHLKAAYIYNIAKFTNWPLNKLSSENTSINFCVYGSNEVTRQLSGIEGQTIGQHQTRILKPEAEEDFQHCHLIYITPEERKRYRYILSLIETNRVITISDDERFIKSGGLINLTELEQRLRFQINKVLLSSQELHISSHLLKLAIMVDE